MPQEEIEKKACDLAIQVSKLSARELIKGLNKFVTYQKQRRQGKVFHDTSVKGKQTVKQLIGQNQGVASLPIGDTGLKDFERIAKKCGVDFAIVKDKASKEAKYTVFFKARDADAISQVLSQYAAKQIKRKEKARPSILKILKKFKEQVASMPRKEKEKKKERER